MGSKASRDPTWRYRSDPGRRVSETHPTAQLWFRATTILPLLRIAQKKHGGPTLSLLLSPSLAPTFLRNTLRDRSYRILGAVATLTTAKEKALSSSPCAAGGGPVLAQAREAGTTYERT